VATTTPRIGLTKPDGTDLVDIAVLNTNFDKIDSNIASTKIQSTKPTTPNAGDLWWDSDTGTLYLYYVDSNSAQWVAATSDPINIGVVASQTERDAQYPTPAQGMSVYRTDLGVTQRYYGLFNASTNPGGMDTAGWYGLEKSAGLIPVSPTSVDKAGTGSTAVVSSIGAVTFSARTSIALNGVFNTNYKNYLVVLSSPLSTVDAVDTRLVFRQAGNNQTSAGYYYQGVNITGAGSVSGEYTTGNTSTGLGLQEVTGPGRGSAIIEFIAPYTSDQKIIFSKLSRANQFQSRGHLFTGTGLYDGFTLYPNSGSLSGTIQVYGLR